MDTPADDFVPVAFDGNFLLTNEAGKVTLAVYSFPGYRPPTAAQVATALAHILGDPRNTGFRPMTREEVELLDGKRETRQ